MEFKTGKVHKTFATKSGKTCIIRWAKWDDLQQLTDFINEIAQEDTYISFSPEDDVTLEFESKFLSSVLSDGSLRRASYIVAEIEGNIVGASGVSLETKSRARSRHVASFGISILEQYRGEGIGDSLIEIAIIHAQDFLEDIKLITLTAFAENKPAIGLYEKHGFKQVGKIPNALFRKNSYSDEIIMIKELPA
ncbi:GNAT family N-acetyltransferase [Candidatus Saccharibacteria bacterium]|jgi:ribosomal protein S18 acetylase RimI-like enzyme|nr:GNAT family N-acetyltransferase [Candidatus Saccharibacteria bacterium]MBP9132206.1 GNAT family N-acetyltransferase [Candidatus Saccharibacteria bacterium]